MQDQNGWAAKRPLSILVAEDSLVLQQLLKAILGGLGHAITVADNGKYAVEKLQLAKFDIILMDVHMPVMDGLQATSTIRALNGAKSKTPIIAVTADTSAGNIEEYLAIGMDMVCGKPLNIPVLLAAIDKLLGEAIHVAPDGQANSREFAAPPSELARAEEIPCPATVTKPEGRFDNFADMLAHAKTLISLEAVDHPLDSMPVMAGMTGVNQKKFAKLIANYEKKLVGQTQELLLSAKALLGDPNDKEARGLLKERAHTLKGGGTTFGYELVTQIAAPINDHLGGEAALSEQDIHGLINRAKALVVVAENKVTGDGGEAGQLILKGLEAFSD